MLRLWETVAVKRWRLGVGFEFGCVGGGSGSGRGARTRTRDRIRWTRGRLGSRGFGIGGMGISRKDRREFVKDFGVIGLKFEDGAQIWIYTFIKTSIETIHKRSCL